MANSKKRIMYLTWGETPRSYGVFGQHVVQQFAATRRLFPSDHYSFVSAVPVLNSGLVREKFKYLQELKSVRNCLDGIEFAILPIYAPQTFVHSNRSTFGWMHGLAHLHLAKKLRKTRPQIVHCRSVHATWAALEVRKQLGFPVKVIFDGRGLWPEETSFKINVSEDSRDFEFLKSVERQCLSESDASVTVSKRWHDLYEQMGAKNDYLISFGAARALFASDILEKQIVKNQPLRFCYLGALSEDTWHRPNELLALYQKLSSLAPNSILTIITTSDHRKIRNAFAEFGDDRLRITSTKSSDELASLLSKQHIGLVSHFVPTSPREKKLADTALAIKTIEYLAAGMPIISSVNCGGAADLIQRENLGITYDPNQFEQLNSEKIQLIDRDMQKRCREFALRNSSQEVVSANYNRLYCDLSKT